MTNQIIRWHLAKWICPLIACVLVAIMLPAISVAQQIDNTQPESGWEIPVEPENMTQTESPAPMLAQPGQQIVRSVCCTCFAHKLQTITGLRKQSRQREPGHAEKQPLAKPARQALLATRQPAKWGKVPHNLLRGPRAMR